MKTELTPELKERFFAQYWGQKVYKNREFDFPSAYGRVTIPSHGLGHGDYLSLRQASNLTDEEAIEVAKIGGVSYQLESSMVHHGRILLREYIDSSRCNVRGSDWMVIQDYLRSIGVCLPFMGHSVDTLVAAGWVKLIEP